MIYYLKKNQQVAILGGKLFNPDKTTQPSAGKFYSLPVVFSMLFGGDRFGFFRKSPANITEVDWVSGGCMMIKKEIFNRLKGFDENFFMYIEDMELCFRAKKAGNKVMFYPDLHIAHEGHKSSNRTFAIIHIYTGLLYFYKKHTNIIAYSILKLLLTTKACGAIILGSVARNENLLTTYKKALAFSL